MDEYLRWLPQEPTWRRMPCSDASSPFSRQKNTLTVTSTNRYNCFTGSITASFTSTGTATYTVAGTIAALPKPALRRV